MLAVKRTGLVSNPREVDPTGMTGLGTCLTPEIGTLFRGVVVTDGGPRLSAESFMVAASSYVKLELAAACGSIVVDTQCK